MRFAWSRFAIYFLLFAALGQALVSGAKRPNILLIVSEDNGPELGCYGDPYVKTPVLDRLAANGIRFNRAYVPQAGCSQSRAALLTGLYPHQNGQIGLATWKFRLYDENTPNLIHSLKQAGYRTGIIGKLHINPASAFPFDVKKISSANFSRKKLGTYAFEAGRFIKESDRPFFLSVNYPDAHRPFLKTAGGLPIKPLTGSDVKSLPYFGVDTPELREQMANYYNCISRLDSLIGELLNVLRESGKFDNTFIVYMGDHGADLLRGKRTSYEGGVRVPLIMHWLDRGKPGRTTVKGVRNELVTTLDLMPTFLEIAGAKPVVGLPGRSLVSMVEHNIDEWRRYLFTEFHTHSAHNFYPQRTIRDERYKLIHNLLPDEINPGYRFTVERFFGGLNEVISRSTEPVRSAYTLMNRPPAYEFYDLESDPFEFRNLVDEPEHSGTLKRLQGQLQAWREKTNDPLLQQENIVRLKREIDACFKDGTPNKQSLSLNYWDYFFKVRN